MADWSCIPWELVCLVAKNFSAIEDYTAFSSVCRSYRFATKEDKWRPVEGSRQPPWLLLYTPDDDEGVSETPRRGLLSMYRNHKRFLMNLPELHDRICWGTPYGWIVTLGFDRKLHLFNPLNRRRIILTDPYQYPEDWEDKDDLRIYYTRRAIVIKRTPPPSSFDEDDVFIVVTVDGFGHVKVMRENTWEDVKFVGSAGYVKDVVCFKGEIYAVCLRGRLLIGSNFDDPTRPPTLDDFVPDLFHCVSTEHFYLVESLGELLLVVRCLVGCYNASSFDVYKLNFQTKRWIQIHNDLGDCALFVGTGLSLSLSQPKDFNLQSNCIYSSDDNYDFYPKGGKDMVIYNFRDGTILDLYEDYLSTGSLPTWFIPALT